MKNLSGIGIVPEPPISKQFNSINNLPNKFDYRTFLFHHFLHCRYRTQALHVDYIQNGFTFPHRLREFYDIDRYDRSAVIILKYVNSLIIVRYRDMTVFRLGVNNCFAVKRWPEPRAWTEIVATKLDVKYVQFSFDLLDPRSKDPALTSMITEIRDTIRDYGIVIHSTFTGLAAYSFNLLMHPNPLMRYDALDWYISAIRATKEMGVESTGGHLAAMSWEYFIDDTKRKYITEILLENIRLLSHAARSYGLKSILWEPMPVVREPPYTINGAKILLRRANEKAGVPVKLCIDLGHSCAWKYESKRDLDPYAWLEELGSESPVIHV
ncbi:MAG: hypothetical protein DRN53_04710 [Thermoprotei archaeon]|nr:MAG: hypothetical protein DRN53_04710 [Thermoprotei archaeon]